MKKKILAAALCAAMLTSTFTGCSGGASSSQPAGSSSGAGSEASSSSSSAAPSTEPAKLTMMGKDMPADDAVTQKLLKSVGEGVSKQLGREVTIEMVPLQEGTYSETMGLKLQSGEIPDIMYFQGGDYQFAVTQKILEDLTPHIEGSTYIKAMMNDSQKARLQNYPYLLWLAADRTKMPVVRTDWLNATESGKKLLEDPSLDNYKAFFTELKTKNNLKAAITVPNDLVELDTIFALAFGETNTWLKGSDGKYIYNKVSPQEKEKLAFYAELYKDGLLDNEYLTKKWDTKEKMFYDGEAGVVCGTQGAVVKVYDNKMTAQNGADAKLTVLPPAKGEAQGYTPNDVSKESRGWAINADSPNKDAAFAVLEYMASPEGQLLDKLGYEGSEYKVENNEIVLTDAFTSWWPRFHESINTFNPEPALSASTPYYPEAAMSSLEMGAKFATNDNTFVLPDEYTTSWDACNALYSEYAADIISGKKGADSFDQFVKEWNELGGAQVTEYANTQLAG